MEKCVRKPDEYVFRKIMSANDIEEIVPGVESVEASINHPGHFNVTYDYHHDMTAQCRIGIGDYVVVNVITEEFEIHSEEQFNRMYKKL